MTAHDPRTLPPDLPEPPDDGACAHLTGLQVPAIPLTGTGGRPHDLAARSREGWVVVFAYPRTGRPGQEPLGGATEWNALPGARGCTPQCLAYSAGLEEFTELGVMVYGLSTQDTEYQREAVRRLGLGYELLSDADLALTRALRLPTFEVAGHTLLRRHTLLLRDGLIRHVRYPVFPPDQDAVRTLTWLRRL
ncbi:redoxin family protein [Sphaerimonospora sp. CA-214678]|uniref:redoxin family protein n=1 Tax=Sphaerimonospora sp. CA-214678 TaxID=3240029 RepID=UPI003D89E9D0